MCYKNKEFSCFYTGQTNNFDKRIKQHCNNVKASKTRKFTGRFDLVKPVWKQKVDTRDEAKIIERKIKNLSHEKKMDLINGRVRV